MLQSLYLMRGIADFVAHPTACLLVHALGRQGRKCMRSNRVLVLSPLLDKNLCLLQAHFLTTLGLNKSGQELPSEIRVKAD